MNLALRCAVVTLLLLCRRGLSADERPNIIMVMADDLGWSDLGCYGGEIPTPHIDRLAEQGLRFSQFYNNAICGPTRASLLTGLYCQQIGHSGGRWNDPTDFSRCATFGELLQEAGYRTMLIGKWQGRDPVRKRGFDRFFGYYSRAKGSYFNAVAQSRYGLDDRTWEIPDGAFYAPETLNAYAQEFLIQALENERPFCLYVAHKAPHWPLHAPEERIAPHRQRYLEAGWGRHRRQRIARQKQMGLLPGEWTPAVTGDKLPDWSQDPHKRWQAERMAVYAAQVTTLDECVGGLLKILDASDRTDNTLVMFLSDNGAAVDGGLAPTKTGFGFNAGNSDNWRQDGVPIRPGSGPDVMPGPADTFAGYGAAWAHCSNAPFRDYKATAWEGGVRTPLVVRWPAVIAQGGRITHEVGHVIDFMATFLDLADREYPEQFHGRRLTPMEGRSLVPVFRGRPRKGHTHLCWSVRGNDAVRAGRWKLIRPATGAAWQLYDLQTDGGETRNLADAHPRRVEQLTATFEQWAMHVAAP